MPQPLTKVNIAKLALTHLGMKPIAAFTDTTVEANKINVVWQIARLTVLRAHPWVFSRRRIELTAEATETLAGWEYIWTFPADTHYIRKVYVDTVSENPERVNYIIFNGTSADALFIATNDVDEDDKCYAETTFTGEGTDDAGYGLYDPLFIQAFAAYLAFLMAQSLTGKESLEKRMYGLYAMLLGEAQKRDAMEGRLPSTKLGSSSFVASRGG